MKRIFSVIAQEISALFSGRTVDHAIAVFNDAVQNLHIVAEAHEDIAAVHADAEKAARETKEFFTASATKARALASKIEGILTV